MSTRTINEDLTPELEVKVKVSWKVYQVNDYEWYMARDIAEAIKCCMDNCGCTYDECINDPREIDGPELEALTFTDDDRDNTKRSFKEELARRVANDPRPQCFASTEY